MTRQSDKISYFGSNWRSAFDRVINKRWMHYTFQIERAIFPACRRICKEAEEGAREGEDECEGGNGCS